MIHKYGGVFLYIGYLLLVIAVMLLSPLVSLVWFPQEWNEASNFINPAVLSAALGQFLIISLRSHKKRVIKKSNQVLIVVLGWTLACLFLALPFVFSGILNFTQAFFEASSGLSTTGLSVVDVAGIDKIYLMHRSFIQFYGGIGIVLILVTIFVNGVGFELYQTEGHQERLIPNAKNSARIIVKIYITFILIGFVLLKIVGMTNFDSINIAMTSIATGGFSVTPGGIGDYSSHQINIIIMILMFIGSISFYTHLLISKGKIKQVFKIDEIRLYLKLILVFIISALAVGYFSGDKHLLTLFETSSFEIISAISGTGFSLINYNYLLGLNQTFLLIILVAMIIGGSIGSTSGGIKVTRLNILLKSLKWNNTKFYSSSNKLIKRTTQTAHGKQVIHDDDVILTVNYILLYLILLVIGTSIFTVMGYSLSESFFEFSSALGNVGLTVGITSPNLQPFLLWVLSLAMFLGRLEIFIVMGVISRVLDKRYK